MAFTNVGAMVNARTGLPIGIINDDGQQMVDDDGQALVQEDAFYNNILLLYNDYGAPVEDDSGALLVDDNGAQIVDDDALMVDDDGTPLQIDPPSPRFTPVNQWLTAKGASLVLEDGTPFRLNGVNWSGCESRMFPGLLSVRAYKSITVGGVVKQGIVDQIAEIGFNAIRFPVCEDMVRPDAVCQSFDGISVELNPDLINYSNLPSGATVANGSALISPIQILDKIVAYAKSLGIRVILDMHCAAPNTHNELGFNGRWYTTTGPQGPSGTTLGLFNDPRSENDLISAWTLFAAHYANEPAVCGFDLINEPWDTTWDDDPMTGLPAVYERIGNAIQQVNPNALIICEGNQITQYQLPQYPSRYGTWPGWGQNLYNVHYRRVNLNIRQDKVCYSPHEYYSPTLDWTENYAFPETMPEVWTTLWGWIVQRDIAPVIIGEWGGNFSGAIPAQQKWANKLMEYLYGEMGGKVNLFHWAMVPGTGTIDANQAVVGLINQQNNDPGGSDTLWPLQVAMASRFLLGAQDV